MKNSKSNKKWKGQGKPVRGKRRNKDLPSKSEDLKDQPSKFKDAYVPGEVNDFDWYNHNPSLTLGAASIQYPFRPGMSIPAIKYLATGVTRNVVIPGVMTLTWFPTIGQSDSNQSPIGIAAREMYGRVRAAYSGTLRADAPDMMIYIQAMDSVYAYISWLKRLYRMVNAQSPDNYIVPDALLMSLGFTKAQCTELRRNKMKLFNAVNVLVGMTDKFRVPDAYPLLRRHVWMNDRVYTDSSSLNAQLYMFNMIKVYKYTLLNTPDNVLAGGLSCIDMPTQTTISGDVVDTLYNFGEELISSLAGSETAYTISGYLERAYEGTRLFSLATLELGEILDFSYDEIVMSQIENATPAASQFGLKANSNDVTQDPKTNSLLCAPQTQATNTTIQAPFVNIHHDAPAISDTVEATRLKNVVVDQAGHIMCSTEILYRITMYVPNSTSTSLSQYAYPTILNLTADNFEVNANYTEAIILAATFDWHPFVAVNYVESETSQPWFIFGDIHNIATLTVEELKELHRVCTLSEYNCFNGV